MDPTVFEGYQLLGASNMVKFCNEIMNVRPVKNEQGCAQIGLCVSGQGIRQLTRRISRAQHKVANNVIICIGTNDVKKLVSLRQFKIALLTLRKTLDSRNIVWLTIPPLLCYKSSQQHVDKLAQFNEAINKLSRGKSNVTILDLHGQCIDANGKIRDDLYTKFYTQPTNRLELPRRDEINFNAMGMRKLAMFLAENLPPVVPE